jgi:acyl CoA:acetate/3-ketoacid CoA transferase beta subunit
MIVTDLAVFSRPDRQSPFRLIETAPDVTIDIIRALTEAQFME